MWTLSLQPDNLYSWFVQTETWESRRNGRRPLQISHLTNWWWTKWHTPENVALWSLPKLWGVRNINLVADGISVAACFCKWQEKCSSFASSRDMMQKCYLPELNIALQCVQAQSCVGLSSLPHSTWQPTEPQKSHKIICHFLLTKTEREREEYTNHLDLLVDHKPQWRWHLWS